MVCSHLAALEQALLASGVKETSRGQAWSKNCREWVYFDVVFDLSALRARFAFAPCVEDSENLDPKSGQERGLYCAQCQDAVMGRFEGAALYP
ncbi:MAG: hypothetical protein AMJ66_04640 [Betaproteobacteria bacterium SG8_40]|nr:MAG: hypothetical protein AMJ66_04640 [Betaproteobacteria bacterium SG8_40]